MNCQTVQNQLLALEDPSRPGGEVRDHLRDCDPCRAWQRELVRLERHVARLPVPPSPARDEMIRQFTATANPEAPAPILSLEHARAPLHRLIPRYRWYAAVGAAAALFLLVFDWVVLWHPHGAPPETRTAAVPCDPFLASLLDRNLRLAGAKSPRVRLEALADLADDLQGQTRKLSRQAEADDLRELARLYEQVVRDGIVRGAAALPPQQRAPLLGDIAERLAKAARDAGNLAGGVPDAPAVALRSIAATARDGGDRLHALLGEGLR